MRDIFRKKDVAKVLKDAADGVSEAELKGEGLTKTLTVRDLTAFGIAAIVGAGIFSTIGKASFDGGPGIIFLFLFVAVACGFSALCYAEFASMVPVSGSAYTYSYVAFGEIIAWIIGWDLLMEYAIGNIAVAISWSDYFTSLLDGFGVHVPDCITMDYWTAHAGFLDAVAKLHSGALFSSLDSAMQSQYLAWTNAPQIFGIHFICDIPAALITVLITYITYIGIKESKNSANLMVLLKLIIILVVIALGAFYVKPGNWHPFMPNGVSGILKGTAAVFFAYIGFDAISTTAEECKDPQRDLPRSMIYSLIICTIIYVLVALVLTGMVNYTKLNVGDPLSFVFQQVNLNWIAGVVAISAVIATASVLLVFQIGQPRIWMSMSRDGLLPPIFSRIHPKFRTPSFSTILTGLVVGIPSLFLNMNVVIDLTSVGTLFAFVLVCGGIIKLQNSPNPPASKFKTPYISGRYIMPVLFILGAGLLLKFNADNINDYVKIRQVKSVDEAADELSPPDHVTLQNAIAKTYPVHFVVSQNKDSVKTNFNLVKPEEFKESLRKSGLPDSSIYNTGWRAFRAQFMLWVFLLLAIVTVIGSVIKKLSLIPVLGFLSCSYLLCESGTTNWERFLVWLLVGFVIYFFYGYRKSKLANA
ncbi:MAG: amino acid transporter [Bacteroidota bacterium]|nr:amino acid transporter [Bacteroidota bacterium]